MTTTREPALAAPVGAGEQSSSRTERRKDIDGLRAVAIILVVLGHVGLNLHGGVDISFLISGFLITFLLLREQEAYGRISFTKFYARRARRLLPAATLVTLATLFAIWQWVPKGHVRSFSMDGLFTTIFGINFRLAAEATNYFSDKARSPFQHAWSLSIDEQFYLVWPVLLVLISWLGLKMHRRRLAIGIMLGAMVVGSVVLTVMVNRTSQPWAYFSPLTRAWELAAGALVAVCATQFKKLSDAWAMLLSWLGLVGLLAAAALVTDATPVPYYGAGGVFGGALVIAAGCANPKYGAQRLLSFGPLRFFGQISYSWYLWHWPILVILPYYLARELTVFDRIGVVLGSLGLAVVTYYALEKPIRENKPLVLKPACGLSLGAHLLVVSVIAAFTFVSMAPSSTPPAIQAGPPPSKTATEVYDAVAQAVALQTMPDSVTQALPYAGNDGPHDCIDGPDTLKPFPCTYGDPNAMHLVVVVGDSHMLQWSPAFDVIGKQLGIKFISYSKSACTAEPYVNVDTGMKRRYTECEQWREVVWGQVTNLHPSAVIVSGDIFEGASGNASAELARRIIAMGAKYALIDDTPDEKKDTPSCLSLHTTPSDCNTPRDVAIFNARIRAERKEAVTVSGGTFVDVVPWFCTATVCPGTINGMIPYRDGTHITATYARWLAPVLQEALIPVLN